MCMLVAMASITQTSTLYLCTIFAIFCTRTTIALLLTLTLTQTLTILPRIMSLYPFVNIVYLILCVVFSKVQFIYLFIKLFNQLQTSIHHGRQICSSELVVGKDWAALIGEFYSATPHHLNKHQELSFMRRTSLHG